MAELLDADSFKNIQKKISSNRVDFPFVHSVLARIQHGRVFIDDEAPDTVLIWHYQGFATIFGETVSLKFKNMVHSLLMRTFEPNQRRFLLLSGHELDWVESFIPTVCKGKRQLFAFSRKNFKKFSFSLPDACAILKLDASFLRSDKVWNFTNYAWTSIEEFEKHGFGFYIACDNMPASIAFTTFVNVHEMEISVETNSNFRRKGLAAAVCSRLIEAILNVGHTPVWSCGLDNTPSISTALKLGFKPTRSVTTYQTPMPTTYFITEVIK